MLEKKIKYVDFNGEKREESFNFNLTKAEIIEMQLEVKGGLQALITKMQETKDIPALAELFKTIIKKSYGVKSADGRNFVKNDQNWEDFHSTQAYSELFMELTQDANAAADFLNGIVPAEIVAEVKKEQQKTNPAIEKK